MLLLALSCSFYPFPSQLICQYWPAALTDELAITASSPVLTGLSGTIGIFGGQIVQGNTQFTSLPKTLCDDRYHLLATKLKAEESSKYGQ